MSNFKFFTLPMDQIWKYERKNKINSESWLKDDHTQKKVIQSEKTVRLFRVNTDEKNF